MSLNVFSKGQTEGDIIVHWKKLNGKQANCLALASKIEPASFAILQQIRNSTGWSAKLLWQLVFRASIQFFVVLDAAVQTQHITNHLVKVPVILMLQSSLLLWGYFHLFRQNGSQHLGKCLLKGMKEPSVSPWTTGSWQVLASASWISPIGRATPCSLLASLQAVPSPSAAAASLTSRRPVPPSASLPAPRNRAEREALPERYYPSHRAQCFLW